MSKKTMKIISIVTIILAIVMIGSMVFGDVNPIDVGNGTLDANAENKMSSIGGSIAAVIRNIGIIAAVIILMVLGLKYMMGSAQEKAEYKKTMIPYVVGAVLLFAASGIAQMVINFSASIK